MLTNDVQTGQRVRITHLCDIIATDDEALAVAFEQARREGITRVTVPKKVVIAAGTVYEGIVTDADDAGFFDLNLDDGGAIGYYAHGPSILIEEIRR
jgi:hypothetical protein